MDDTAQSPGQLGQQMVSQPSVSQSPLDNTQNVPSVQQPVGPQGFVQQTSVQNEPVAQSHEVSVPTGGKEHDVTIAAEVQPTLPEIVIPQEIQEAGVEATPAEEPQLTEEHKEAGIEAVKEAAPLPSGPTKVQLPDDYKAPKGFFSLFHQKVKNAATWLYLLLFKAEQQAAEQATHEKKSV